VKGACFALILVLLMAASSRASELNWLIWMALYNWYYPYGDNSGVMGVAQDSTWDYDLNDAACPPIIDPEHDCAMIYDEHYYQIFIDEGYGWPPPWKPGAGIPRYPKPGLMKDTREPILAPGQPEFWLMRMQAPNLGQKCEFIWELNLSQGFEVPSDIEVKIWGNPDLESVGVEGDLILTDLPGYHHLPVMEQWGQDENGDPIIHWWVIEARMIPEPAAGLPPTILVLAVLNMLRRPFGVRRRRRWRGPQAGAVPGG
jgi:hypothetical protein